MKAYHQAANVKLFTTSACKPTRQFCGHQTRDEKRSLIHKRFHRNGMAMVFISMTALLTNKKQ